jgi:nucleotide-binding universal stress UspA family protein
MEQHMRYKTIMVSLALDRSNDACLAVAGDLAERSGARVIGIVASDIRPTLYFAEGNTAQAVLEEEAAAVQKRLSELETEFRAAIARRAKAVEWRSALTLPIPYVVQHARAADVLVVGQRTEALVDPCVAADPGDLVMQAGRPLIVVPPTVQWLDLRSVLVAWKDVREARRAVFDALPILATAKEVTIAEMPEQGVDRAEAMSHVEDVAGWLRGHGIVANAVVPEAESEVAIAGQLDNVAANVGAGVVIAGAYGHSRFREWILGGVTRHLAAESGRCALLSR